MTLVQVQTPVSWLQHAPASITSLEKHPLLSTFSAAAVHATSSAEVSPAPELVVAQTLAGSDDGRLAELLSRVPHVDTRWQIPRQATNVTEPGSSRFD